MEKITPEMLCVAHLRVIVEQEQRKERENQGEREASKLKDNTGPRETSRG